MAVAIIRQLTLAQVQAAIDAGSTSWNNNYTGTQVYVTDKDWHLACYLDRVAKPLSGVLKITNGDTLPAWLVPETLLIDTGTITTDISSDTGTPLTIVKPNGYIPMVVYLSVLVQADVLSGIYLLDSAATEIINWADDFYVGEYILIGKGNTENRTHIITDGNCEFRASGNGSTNTCQAIIEFKKSYL